MAEHYGTVVLPARPLKPRDKSKVVYCASSELPDTGMETNEIIR